MTEVRQGQTRNGGKPYGIVKLEDYSGAGESALFGEDWAKWCGFMKEGNSLFVTARTEPHRWKEGEIDLRIGKIEFLGDVSEKNIKSITITINLDALDENVADELSALVDKSPGNVEMIFDVFDQEHNYRVALASRKKRIKIEKELLEFIDGHWGLSYKIN